jgi:hypothetical protein
MEKLFENAQTLTLFLLFFVPGFVSLKVYDSLVPSERRDFSKSIFDAVAYSALNFAALYALIAWMRSGTMNTPTYALAAVLVMVLFPGLWPFFWIWLLSTRLFNRYFIHPIQRPLDYVFGKRRPCWMIVHLKDQRRIGWLFDSDSFASSYPAEPQLYLQEVWKLDADGRFFQRVERSEGMIVLKEEIIAVELFKYSE